MSKFKILIVTIFGFLLTGCLPFLQPETPREIDPNKPLTIFVLDISGSMESIDAQSGVSMIKTAKQTIKDIALKLDTNKTNLSLVSFGGWCSVDTEVFSTSSKDELIGKLQGLSADGKTPLALAIKRVSKMANKFKNTVNIILLSDGLESCGGNPLGEINALVANNPQINFNAFVLGYNVDSGTRNMLSQLSYGKGVYYDVLGAAELSVILNRIITTLDVVELGWENGVYNFLINFDHDSDIIKAEFAPNLARFASYLISSNAKAEIGGHTDNVGNANYNKNLSKRRAKSVRDALVALGVRSDRLSYKGYGETNPKVPNTTRENRYKNRRVEARVY